MTAQEQQAEPFVRLGLRHGARAGAGGRLLHAGIELSDAARHVEQGPMQDGHAAR